MTKIYELDQQQSEILDRLYWLDENSEEDAEQVERLKKDLLKIRDSAENTVAFLSNILLESRAILEAREEVKRRAERRRKTAERSVERLTTIIEHILRKFELKKVVCESCDISIQKNPPSLVYAKDFDPATLPPDTFQVIYKPLNKEIKAYMENGATFDGITLQQTESLRIR